MAQNTNTTAKTEAKAEAVKQIRRCACSCDLPVAGKSAYRQGHDAKHVSKLAEIAKLEAVNADADQFGLTIAALAVKLPSGRLQTKFIAAVTRWMYKQFDRDHAAAKKNDSHEWVISFHPDDVRVALEGMENTQLGDRSTVSRNDVPVSETELIEEENEAETARPEPMWDDTEGETLTEVKVGRWTYPARMIPGGEIERNTKRDGSGEWVAFTK